MATKRPSFQFYPGDWLEDIGLRASSLAARGLWADMLCFMHQGEPYGHLRKDGRDVTAQDLARMVGAPPRAVRILLAELGVRHVFSRTEEGTIFSRRQVRDEALRQIRAEGGPKAVENPRASRAGDRREGGRHIDKDGVTKGGDQGATEGVAQGGVGRTPPPSPSPSATAAAATENGPTEGRLSKQFLSREEFDRTVAEGEGYLDELLKRYPDQDRGWLLRRHSTPKGGGGFLVRLDLAKGHEHLIRTVQSLRDAVEAAKSGDSGEKDGLLTSAEHERRRRA